MGNEQAYGVQLVQDAHGPVVPARWLVGWSRPMLFGQRAKLHVTGAGTPLRWATVAGAQRQADELTKGADRFEIRPLA
jgi:hypothetical protein